MASNQNPLVHRSRQRDILELGIAYGLILLVIWTPRPWQKLLWVVAAGFIAVVTCFAFEGLKAMGLRTANLFRSSWVVGVALAGSAAAVTLAASLHTLRMPGNPILFAKTYTAYAIWAFAQQFLLQSIFLSRLLRLMPNTNAAVAVSALIFAVAHLPNPILTPITLVLGVASCMIFMRYRNLYSLAVAHAILGISIAITVPGPIDHNMRVGLSYLNYGQSRAHLAQP